MSDIKKLVCIGVVAVIVAMAIYPPFQVQVGGNTQSVGYGWIVSPPLGGAATIDIGMLLAQWAVVLGIGVIAFIFLKDRS